MFIDEDRGTDETLSEIGEILKPHTIPFIQHRIANKVNNFFQPGSKVTGFSGYGTLGGFVWGTCQYSAEQKLDVTDEAPTERTLCALLSGHVSKLLPGKKLKVDDNCIGQVMDPPWQHGNALDIAAATIDKAFAPRCVKMFKDDKGNHKSGKLYDSGSNDPSFLPTIVHLYGAETVLGLGEILLKKCSLKSCLDGNESDDGKFMLLTDRKPFSGELCCRSGDSGAIVCANDKRGKFVLPIAMIIGEIESKTTNENRYLATQLYSGLEQMSLRYNLQFSLCEEHVANT